MKEYQEKITGALLHCHTEASIKDSAMSAAALVKKAKELGAPAIAITNHGNCVDNYSFYMECMKEGIKPILGLEAYVGNRHLILMAADDLGYRAICRLVYESNKHIVTQRPRMDKEILSKHIGKGSEGYGHVIGTSACVGGVLSGTFLVNEDVKKELCQIEKKIEKAGVPGIDAGTAMSMAWELTRSEDELSLAKKELSQIKADAKKATAGLEKRVSSLCSKVSDLKEDAECGDGKKEERAKQKLAMEQEKLNSLSAELSEILRRKAKAKELLPYADTKVHDLADKVSRLKKGVNDANKVLDRLEGLMEMKEAAMAKEKTEQQMAEDLMNEARWYKDLFAPGMFFVEIQYHGDEKEAIVAPYLVRAGRELEIPFVAANDAHMPDRSEESVRARQLMRSMDFDYLYRSVSPMDRELYVKSDKELAEYLLKVFPEDVVEEAMANTGRIAGLCTYGLKKENHYPKFSDDPDAELRNKVEEGITWRFPEGLSDEYRERLEHELNVISTMGYSDYHLIVADFLEYARWLGYVPKDKIEEAPLSIPELKEWCKKNGYDAGIGIGFGRGSAAGSIVCYLLGITELDPIKYNLLFERFLNIERVSMPDIDSDFKTDIRDKVIKYCEKKYGEESVACILTRGTLAARNSINNTARVIGVERRGDKGAFSGLADMMSRKVPEEPGIKLSHVMNGLREEFGGTLEGKAILDGAELVEGTTASYGMHAAGVIISDGQPIKDLIPLMWDPKNERFKTQCTMTEAEDLGFLKMDFLGLNTLDVITDTIRTVKERTGKVITLRDMDLMDKEVYRGIYTAGRTAAVFQVESAGMKRLMSELRPDCFEDIILAVAIYRPGPMDSIPDVIRGKRDASSICFATPELEPILGNTYGVIIYQEQVMQVFQSLAGYSLGQADLVRRAMGKKKEKILLAEKDAFINGDASRNITGCIANGIKKETAEALFERMKAFAKYAFNKSHAAVYALVSYATAWLKHYFPAEFISAVLSNAPSRKKMKELLGSLVPDCERLGIRILAPDVNASCMGFSVCGSDIRFGLSCIDGVAAEGKAIIMERDENGPFTSFPDFIIRTRAKKSAVVNLAKAGAFDSLCPARRVLVESVDQAKAIANKMKEASESYSESLRNEMEELFKNDRTDHENMEGRYLEERSVSGMFLSGHPVSAYRQGGATRIAELTEGRAFILAFLPGDSLNFRTAKKSGREFAIFEAEDQTGSIKSLCFSDVMSRYRRLLVPDTVVMLEGECRRQDGEDGFEFIVKRIREPQRNWKDIVIETDSIQAYVREAAPILKELSSIDGEYRVNIYDRMRGKYAVSEFCVTKDIFVSGLPVRTL